MLQIINRIAWTGRMEFQISGRYLELLDTVSAVDVYAYDANGSEIVAAVGVEQGFYIDRAGVEPFTRIAIVTSAAESPKFVVTDGRAGTRAVPIDVQDDATTRGAYTQDGLTQGAADAQILAANTSRKFLAIQNQDASADLYVTCDGSAATADKESLKIAAGGYWEPRVVPTGEIRGISSSGNISIHYLEA